MTKQIVVFVRWALIIVLIVALIITGNMPMIDLKINLKDYFKVNVELNKTREENPVIVPSTNNTISKNEEPIKKAPDSFKLPEAKPVFVPVRITVPSVKIDAKVEPVEIKDGQLQAPVSSSTTGWYKDIYPSDIATSIIDGHYDNRRGPAVFYNLQYLKVGDKIQLFSEDNQVLTYKVTLLESYDRTHAPTDKVYKNDGKQKLNLITCSGTFDKLQGTYNKRLVVYSEIEN